VWLTPSHVCAICGIVKVLHYQHRYTDESGERIFLQDYYVPIYFERYKQDVVLLIDKEFTELTV
jgi:hypothetical protein